MATVQLKREVPKTQDIDIDVAFHKKVAKVLGYRHGLDIAQGNTASGRLAAAFAKIGLQPFTDESVDAYREAKEKKNPGFSWEDCPIEEYTRPIPEFALQTAMDLKKLLPGATFQIDELVEDKNVGDPFLVMTYPGDDGDEYLYYMEVWNEPGFSGERVK